MPNTSQTVGSVQQNISIAFTSARVPTRSQGEQLQNDYRNLCINTWPVTEHLLVGGLPRGKMCDLLFCLNHKQMALRSLHYGGATVPGLLFPCGSFVGGVSNHSQRFLFHTA